jgi:hypothetical protein
LSPTYDVGFRLSTQPTKFKLLHRFEYPRAKPNTGGASVFVHPLFNQFRDFLGYPTDNKQPATYLRHIFSYLLLCTSSNIFFTI